MAYELIKVSELPELTTPSDPNALPIQDGDYLKRISFENLKEAVTGDVAGDLAAEVTARESAVSGEATARGNADTAILADLASPYSASATYAVGDYCTKDGVLKRCNTAITTAEAWNSAHWDDAKLGGDVSTLRSALHQTKTRNLFNPYASYNTVANTAVSVNGNDVTITSINNANKYKYAEWFVDVRGKNYITVSFSEASGTGDVYVRLSYSVDGVTHGDWFGFTTASPKTFDVTSYDYVGIALYAVLATNSGIGNYITYKDLMVEYGNNFTDYIPALVVNDQTARETASYAKEQIDLTANLEAQALFTNAVWEVGGIDGNGKNNSNSKAIRVINYMRIPDTVDVIDIGTDSGYLYGFYLYDASFANLFATTTWQATLKSYSVPNNAAYCRAIVKNSNDDAGDITWKTHLHCTGTSKLHNEVVNLIGGIGSNVYTGEEIDLALSKRKHNCDISLWLDVNSTDFPVITNYRVYGHQSMAIYNTYMFVFFGSGGGIVIDCDNKTIINGFDTTPTAHNHQNSAQFTDVFYDENDEFPLIAISMCGNSSPNDPQTEYDSCLIYRITRSETTFTFTQINTIDCNIISYGCDWAIDLINRTITMITPKNGTYDVTENNPILFSTWVMPEASDILSGTPINLLAKDRIGVMELDNFVMQSACTLGTNIFIGAQDGTTTRYVYVVDRLKGVLKTKIPLINTHELEGVAIYDNKLYVTHRHGSEVSEPEPLQIYEITF